MLPSEDRAVIALDGTSGGTPSLWLLLVEVEADFRPSGAFETVREP